MVTAVLVSSTGSRLLTKEAESAYIDKRITGFLRERMARLDDPRSVGHSLKGPRFGGYWRYRVGDYRLICDIFQETVTILVLRIGNRRDIYR